MGELVTREQNATLEAHRTSARSATAPEISVSPPGALAKSPPGGPPAGFWSRFSLLLNRFRKRRIDSAREIARAEREFIQEIDALERVRAKYQDVEVDIESEKQLRRAQHLTAQLEQEIAIEEKRLRLEQLKQASAQLAEGGEDTYQVELEAAMRRADFEMAMRIIQAKKRFKMRAELLRERERMIAEVLNGGGGKPTPEQEQQLEHIREFFQKMIEELDAGAGTQGQS
jgi:hypothetical protein